MRGADQRIQELPTEAKPSLVLAYEFMALHYQEIGAQGQVD